MLRVPVFADDIVIYGKSTVQVGGMEVSCSRNEEKVERWGKREQRSAQSNGHDGKEACANRKTAGGVGGEDAEVLLGSLMRIRDGNIAGTAHVGCFGSEAQRGQTEVL